jgi:hypothetical protein
MAAPVTARPAVVSVITVARLFMFVAFVCFLIASLFAAGLFSGLDPWAFGFGGFAAVALAWSWTAWPA